MEQYTNQNGIIKKIFNVSENDFNFTIIKLSPMYLEDIIQLSEPSFECNDVEVPLEFGNSLCANLLRDRFNV
jgi:hypothetical protein